MTAKTFLNTIRDHGLAFQSWRGVLEAYVSRGSEKLIATQDFNPYRQTDEILIYKVDDFNSPQGKPILEIREANFS